jgi:hypothetical protein
MMVISQRVFRISGAGIFMTSFERINGVDLDLDAFAQRFFENRLQLRLFLGEITGSLRHVRVRLEQRGAAGAVENDFDGSLGEMAIKLIQRRTIVQQGGASRAG